MARAARRGRLPSFVVAVASRRSTTSVSIGDSISAASSSRLPRSRPHTQVRAPAAASRRTTVGPTFPVPPATAITRPSRALPRRHASNVEVRGVASAHGREDVRRAAGAVPEHLADRHPPLHRRRREDGRRRALDQLRRAGSADPRLPGLRGTLPLPRPEPAPRPEVAGDLRHVTADSPACRRLLLLAPPRAGHARGASPLRDGVARRRAQRAPVSEAPGSTRRDRTDQAAHRGARGGDDHPLLHDGRGGRSRRGTAAPDLRMRPRPRVAGVEDREPAGVRRGGRPAPGRARRAIDGGSRARAGRAASPPPARPGGRPQARPRRQRSRERVARPRRALATCARRSSSRTRRSTSSSTSRRSTSRAGSWRSGSAGRTSGARASSCA